MISTANFRKTIRDHYRDHKRPMPWRSTRDPYRILVSEVMLQQTQVSRVVGFYKNFIKKFPDFRALAAAKTGDVLLAWQGLGYNRRALALQRLAKEVVANHNGKLPHSREALIALPGIGPYTAGAICAFAFNEPEIFIETNIRRVFIHFFFPRKKKVTDAELQRYIERTLDRKNPREWYYALMDYGSAMSGSSQLSRQKKSSLVASSATKKTHGVLANPNRRSAHYAKQSSFAGSDREIRGKILKILLEKRKVFSSELGSILDEPLERILKITVGLRKDGFVREGLVKKGSYIELLG